MLVRLKCVQYIVHTLLLLFAGGRKTQALSIAGWYGCRAGLIRDSIYIEGGYIIDGGNWTNGQWKTASIMNQTRGVLTILDLTVAFTASNYSHALQLVRPFPDADRPNFVNGAGFSTDTGFVLVSGQPNKPYASPHQSSLYSIPYSLPESRGNTSAMTLFHELIDGTAGVYQNITTASSVSVPSENLGFSVGGMARQDYTYLRYPLRTNDTSVVLATSNFYQWNTTDLQNPTAHALGSSFEPRAQAELLWLPFGHRGALVLIGGTASPADIFPAGSASALPNKPNNFMTLIHIYDIAAARWYEQSVNMDGSVPPQTVSFCAVSAVARDKSSYNIYIYGGGDGSGKSSATDDIWILSLPAFQWIKVSLSSNYGHGRMGHRCFTPYPNQMITVGGTRVAANPLGTPDFFDVFNLNTLNWTGRYDPLEWSEYGVPDRVSARIGGNKQGGARISDHLNKLPPDLAALFRTPHTGKVTKYYPYARKNVRYYIRKVPHWLRLVIGMLVYLSVLSIAFVCLMILRQRKLLKKAGLEGSDLGPGHTVLAYLSTRFKKHPKTHERTESADGKLKPLSLLQLDLDTPVDSAYTDNESDVRSVRTRMTERSDQRLLPEEFEMDTVQTPYTSRL